MSRKVNDPEFRNEWKIIKNEFERCAKLIKNYESRSLNDVDRINRYRDEIVEAYNTIVQYIGDNIVNFERRAQDIFLQKIDGVELILRNRLRTLHFEVEFPPDRLDLLTSECIKQITEDTDEASGSCVSAIASEADVSLEFDDNSNDDLKNIEQVNLNANENGTDSSLINNNSPVSQANLIMEKPAFVALMAANIRHNFSGDPLTLPAFIASIDFLKELATTPDLLTLLKKFVITKLEGRAAEMIPANVESVDELIKILRERIKHENSKVIEGRMMALRADRAKFQEYANQVEELADALRRTLISDGMPRELAERQVIDKTIDLCRSNTQNATVKSVLVSKKFEDAKEVVAEFIIQSNTVRQEAQVLSLRKYQGGHFNGPRNFRRGNFNNRRNSRFSGRFNRNFNGNRAQFNNDRGANNGRDRGNERFQGGGNRSRNVRVAENATATQSTLGNASE